MQGGFTKDREGIGARIREARARRGLSQTKLAQLLGIPPQNVSDWERGVVTPSSKNLKKLAEVLEVSLDWLITGKGSPEPVEGEPVAFVPVYATVPGGPPNDQGDIGIIGYIPVPPEYLNRDVYGLQVNGDSMSPLIEPGDRVLVARDVIPENGDVVVVRVLGEPTMKRIRVKGETVYLYSDNPRYEPIIAHVDEVEILGVVIEVNKRLK